MVPNNGTAHSQIPDAEFSVDEARHEALFNIYFSNLYVDDSI